MRGVKSMLYYRVKKEYDLVSRIDGSILIADELYTKKEKDRFCISNKAVSPVGISKKDVYFFFGARFERRVNR